MRNGADKKDLMKIADDFFQMFCKCAFLVAKFHCDNQFEPKVDEWRVK